MNTSRKVIPKNVEGKKHDMSGRESKPREEGSAAREAEFLAQQQGLLKRKELPRMKRKVSRE